MNTKKLVLSTFLFVLLGSIGFYFQSCNGNSTPKTDKSAEAMKAPETDAKSSEQVKVPSTVKAQPWYISADQFEIANGLSDLRKELKSLEGNSNKNSKRILAINQEIGSKLKEIGRDYSDDFRVVIPTGIAYICPPCPDEAFITVEPCCPPKPKVCPDSASLRLNPNIGSRKKLKIAGYIETSKDGYYLYTPGNPTERQAKLELVYPDGKSLTINLSGSIFK